jgi:hypothetical protein
MLINIASAETKGVIFCVLFNINTGTVRNLGGVISSIPFQDPHP